MPTRPSGLDRRAILAAGLAAALPAAATEAPPPIVELRQYTCRAGRRDELITLFEQRFVAPQDAVGARVLGIFRDRDDPDRFAWMRGFDSMAARADALTAFYDGPVWRAHREAANATILDSDNVLLLRPTQPGGGLGPARGDGRFLAFIHYLDDALIAPFGDYFETYMRPSIAADGAEVMATFSSETSRNTFPRLPIRERDRVFVWFARPGAGGEAAFLARRGARSGWRDAAPETLLLAFMRKPERVRLAATAGSPLR
jgi:hypothetical protein